MKDSWSLEWICAQVLQEEFRRKELTAAAVEGGGSAYGMKGFKGRGSKKGKAKEGSGGEQYSGGKRSNKGGKRCGGKCWYCHVEGHPWFKCRKLPDGWRPGKPSIEGPKGVHGAMGEGMGSEEGDGGAGGHGGMFYHVGEACSEDMVVPASKVALHRSSHWVIEGTEDEEGEKLVLFLVYMDDILLFSSSMKEIQKVQQQLMKNFKCKNLGEVKNCLGMTVERDLDHRWLKLLL
ncbi:unnamed protein product [Closterium sp. NIES-53]